MSATTSATTIGPLHVQAVRFFSTHHASAADALAGRERAATTPGYDLLVGRARRFTSLVTQLHIEMCGALHGASATPPASGGRKRSSSRGAACGYPGTKASVIGCRIGPLRV